jgi:peptidoglycan hydrolase CwlO-like protein
MEKKKTATKTTAKKASRKKPAETSNEKISRLTNSIDALTSEIENLKSNIQKDKDEHTHQTSSIDALSSEIETLKLNIQNDKNESTLQSGSIDALSSEIETLKLDLKKEKEGSTKTNSMDTLTSEVETLKLNIQKRKSENTTLKILFYTGLIVLLLGFMYTNSTLQRAQMDNLESSVHGLRTLMNKELLSFEKNVYQKFDLLEKNAGEQSIVNLQESLANMTEAISRLDPDNEKTAELIDLVKKHSKELRAAYSEQSNSASP